MGWLRHIRTTQERRVWFIHLEEMERPPGRLRRSPHNLPNYMDEFIKPWNQRSWKEYRKTQYKAVEHG